MSKIEDIGVGVDPEITKEFEGLWVRLRLYSSSKQVLAFFKKAGERSALFISPTKQAPFAVLYDDIEEISAYSGSLKLPDGVRLVLNGRLIEVHENKV